jgi:hypothetical protein
MSAITVIVTDPPAGTVNIPVVLLKLTIVDETAAPSVNLLAPLNKYTFVKEASADTPILFNFNPVTVTVALSPFKKVNLAKGANACPSTTVPDAGLFEANITVRPEPVGTGVVGFVGVDGDPPNHAFNSALVKGPTWLAEYPNFATWNF